MDGQDSRRPPSPRFGEPRTDPDRQGRQGDRRIIVLIVAFATIAGLATVGAYLLGTGSKQTAPIQPGSGAGGPPATTLTLVAPPTAVPSPATAASTVPADTTPTTEAETIGTSPPETSAEPQPETTSTTTSKAPPAPTSSLPNLSAAAQQHLTDYFAQLQRGDFSSAYPSLAPAFEISFAEYVDFWGVDVASFEAPVDGCNVVGDSGICIVRFFITYSNEAGPDFRGRCFAESSELELLRTGDGFIIEGQQRIETLTC